MGDVDGEGIGGDSLVGWSSRLARFVCGADDIDDGGGDDGAEVYFDLCMRLIGEMGGMNDVVGDSDGEDDDFEGIMMNPVGDIGEIGEPDDAEGILIKLGAVIVGDIGEESNSDGAVAGETSELASLSVWEEFV